MLHGTIRYDNEWVVRNWVGVFLVYSCSFSLLVSLQHLITTSPTHVASVTGRISVCVCAVLACGCVASSYASVLYAERSKIPVKVRLSFSATLSTTPDREPARKK